MRGSDGVKKCLNGSKEDQEGNQTGNVGSVGGIGVVSDEGIYQRGISKVVLGVLGGIPEGGYRSGVYTIKFIQGGHLYLCPTEH